MSFVSGNFNNMIGSSIFPVTLKVAHITPVFKKDTEIPKKILDLLLFCLISETFIKIHA